MPDKKRQHYVPQFYLKLFSDDQASVCLHNLTSGKAVARASIKHQACKSYFYGKEGKVEGTLSTIEGVASTIIHRILRTGRLPLRFSEAHHILASYLIVQLARTVQAQADANEMANKVGKEMLRHHLKDPELLAYLDQVKITLTDGVSMLLRPALLEVPVMLDLKFKLIHNITEIPFITSDHPAVKHNELFSGEETVSVTGLANSGVQLLLPLSPEFAIVFYDEAVYQFGQPASNVVKIAALKHVRALNAFQWANAHENLYFSSAYLPLLADDQAEFGGLHQDEHVAMGSQPIENAEDGRRGILLSVQTRPSSWQLHMPLFRSLIRALPLCEVGRLPLRNPEWAHFVRALTTEVEAGRMTGSEFWAATKTIPVVRRRKR